ncbi:MULTISPECIES: O-acetyl-ADP-ribose deacetylase [Cedecea]|uniref:O-acetyl-ADP-ribose deacetylase n=1 Tax=Cedecea davisae TaxID=158484 RepID=A0ABS6DLC4_9ENTR|nr:MULTISPECIES: O-acetyl-ADP-ribose deacetylase [Cedecea]MBU4684026.1 O-acetyl-ADP-ribose deacetylase [Cedecea davisae]MBU4688175.1 O-acetyl-ADP-ribose deacetylase [Cedecea davisae]QIX94314.1 O-acetyl-ADP-ribose deacetylase [Cedecea sp. FDAARGOS_727]
MSERIQVVQGDITKADVDVIVNAANPSLMGGGGVDGAIHRAAGPALLAACKVVLQHQGECAPGHAVITEAGNIPVKAVIHAVGPVWHGGEQNEAELLELAYRNCLDLAAANGYRTIAFPAISTGVYGFPKQQAARIAWDTVYKYIGIRPLPEQVVFVCFDDENTAIYQQIAADCNK